MLISILVSSLASAVLAFGLALAVRRLLRGDLAERYSVPAALAGAVLTGYWLLPDWAPLEPATYWHWWPHATVAVSLVAALAAAAEIRPLERLLANMAACAWAADCLLPDWADLNPSRPWMILATAVAGGMLAWGIDRAARRRPLSTAGAVTTAALAAAAMVGIEVSLKFGQLAIVAAAGLAGVWLALWRLQVTSVRGLGLVYTVCVGGVLVFAHLQPTEPQRSMLLLAAAPLAVLLGGLPGLRGRTGAVLQAVVMAAILAASWAMVRLGS